MSKLAVGPALPPIHWVAGAFSPRVEHPVHEADH